MVTGDNLMSQYITLDLSAALPLCVPHPTLTPTPLPLGTLVSFQMVLEACTCKCNRTRTPVCECVFVCVTKGDQTAPKGAHINNN